MSCRDASGDTEGGKTELSCARASVYVVSKPESVVLPVQRRKRLNRAVHSAGANGEAAKTGEPPAETPHA
jgi:hypothetical protein